MGHASAFTSLEDDAEVVRVAQMIATANGACAKRRAVRTGQSRRHAIATARATERAQLALINEVMRTQGFASNCINAPNGTGKIVGE